MYNFDHTATECIGQKYCFFSSLLNQLMSSLDSFIQLCALRIIPFSITIKTRNSGYAYAECHFAECQNKSIVLNVIMLSVGMLNVIMLSVGMLNVIMLSFIVQNVEMLNVVALKKALVNFGGTFCSS